MKTMKYEQCDIVKLKDGREGSVLEIFQDGGFLLELSQHFDGEGYFIGGDDVDPVIYAKQSDFAYKLNARNVA